MISALGECLVGTTDALRAALEEDGSLDPVLVRFGGTLIAFTMWWPYFVLPAGTALRHRRERSFVFGYSHMLVFASITAVRAGLRVYAAYFSEAHAPSNPTVIIAIAVPVTAYTLMLLFLYGYMLKVDLLHVWIAVMSVALGLGAVLLVPAGSPPLILGFGILGTPPVMAIILDERIGHAHRASALASIIKPRTKG